MKNNIALIIVFLGLLTSCYKPYKEPAGSKYTPILMTRQQLNNSFAIQSPRTMKNTGKIYAYASYIFVNEKYEGFHIISNSNPSSPQKIAFVKIPGNIDIAVKGNRLFADNGVDLLTINIANPMEPTLLFRNQNELPSLLDPDGNRFYGGDANRIVVGWKLNNTQN
ncbi:MAG: hypothetical protein EAZ85_14440 [Bacteroidetes bacterium]|nr:MAG: hypothetical protein EAZ85_14440 [Bacteroidota bacterium]TAG86378.1 MAG: hypothetical protein EAZ20_12890 [Bacteroidota bacterium]